MISLHSTGQMGYLYSSGWELYTMYPKSEINPGWLLAIVALSSRAALKGDS